MFGEIWGPAPSMPPGSAYTGPVLVLLALSCSSAPEPATAAAPDPAVEFTWMGITNWLVQTPHSTVLLDAYFSRPQEGNASTPEGIETLLTVLDHAGVTEIDHIFVGHSHFDHALDAGTAAIATGAQLWGSPTTCLIADAQGLPADRCTLLTQGDALSPSEDIDLRVARTPHWWPTVSGIGTHEELDDKPDEARVGDAPHGGVLTMHLNFGLHGTAVFQNTLGPLNADDGSGEDYPANLAWLVDDQPPVDAWLTCPNCTSTADPLVAYVDALEPGAIVAHHWDNALQRPTDGLATGFLEPSSFTETVERTGVTAFVPTQLFERFELREGDWMRLNSSPIQAALDLDPDGP